MSSSAINAQLFQAKIGSIQNQADSTSVYSAGVWSFKNSTALTSVTITDAGNVGVGATTTSAKLTIKNPNVSGEQQILDIQNAVSTGQIASLSFNQTDDMLKLSVKAGTGYLAFGTGATGAERMRIDASGRLMVGATSSDYIFRANGFSHFGDAYDAGQYGAIQISRPQATSNKFHLACISSALQVCGLGFLNNSNVFAVNNASSSNSNGVSLATGGTGWSPLSSDIRKKKNFETTQGLAEVLQIEPVKYHLLDDEDMQPKRLGFKAQNLQPLIPEMVIPNGQKAEDGSDYLTITPDYILPVLVKAIQEQQAQIEALKAEVAALKAP